MDRDAMIADRAQGEDLVCYVKGKRTNVGITDAGLALVHTAGSSRRISCCWKATEDSLLPDVIPYSDLLGARVDTASRVVRLLHCPPSKRVPSPRARRDILLHIGGSAGSSSAPTATAARQEDLRALEAWAEQVSQRCVPCKQARRFLVFVNPASGSGTAQRVWSKVWELWAAVPGISCKVVTTTHMGHASEHVRSMDLESCDAIIIVSGDGLVHEVWNGLAQRLDAERALQLPIGHIPGGSGNGLATSVLAACGASYGVLDMAFLIAKGGQQPIHLMQARLADAGPPKVSFLSLEAATMSDVDLSSERLRCLGDLRFTVWGAYRVLRPLRLRARLAYWPAEAPGVPPQEAPSLSVELSGEPWRVIEDDFAVFHGVNIPWVSRTTCMAPRAAMRDGLWHLILVRWAQRRALLRMFLALDDGTGAHLDVPGMELICCRAFRLTPLEDDGLYALDGEQVTFGPIQVWPAHFVGRVLGC